MAESPGQCSLTDAERQQAYEKKSRRPLFGRSKKPALADETPCAAGYEWLECCCLSLVGQPSCCYAQCSYFPRILNT